MQQLPKTTSLLHSAHCTAQVFSHANTRLIHSLTSFRHAHLSEFVTVLQLFLLGRKNLEHLTKLVEIFIDIDVLQLPKTWLQDVDSDSLNIRELKKNQVYKYTK